MGTRTSASRSAVSKKGRKPDPPRVKRSKGLRREREAGVSFSYFVRWSIQFKEDVKGLVDGVWKFVKAVHADVLRHDKSLGVLEDRVASLEKIAEPVRLVTDVQLRAMQPGPLADQEPVFGFKFITYPGMQASEKSILLCTGHHAESGRPCRIYKRPSGELVYVEDVGGAQIIDDIGVQELAKEALARGVKRCP